MIRHLFTNGCQNKWTLDDRTNTKLQDWQVEVKFWSHWMKWSEWMRWMQWKETQTVINSKLLETQHHKDHRQTEQLSKLSTLRQYLNEKLNRKRNRRWHRRCTEVNRDSIKLCCVTYLMSRERSTSLHQATKYSRIIYKQKEAWG